MWAATRVPGLEDGAVRAAWDVGASVYSSVLSSRAPEQPRGRTRWDAFSEQSKAAHRLLPSMRAAPKVVGDQRPTCCHPILH